MSSGIWAFLTGAPIPEEEGQDREDYIGLEFFGNVVVGERRLVSLEDVWLVHREQVLAWWSEHKPPGTRPSLCALDDPHGS